MTTSMALRAKSSASRPKWHLKSLQALWGNFWLPRTVLFAAILSCGNRTHTVWAVIACLRGWFAGFNEQANLRLIRLAFLAPEMVERIVARRQPPELTAQSLQVGRFDIPVGWAAQKRALGFAPPA